MRWIVPRKGDRFEAPLGGSPLYAQLRSIGLRGGALGVGTRLCGTGLRSLAVGCAVLGCAETATTPPVSRSVSPASPVAVAPKPAPPERPLPVRPMPPHNEQATLLARARLWRQLTSMTRVGLVGLGHQDALAYGVGWRGDSDRSDVKSLCGAHPLVVGWDLFGLELGRARNGDGVSFELVRRRAVEVYSAGGLNTASWHAHNPLTGGDAWDRHPAALASLPGGEAHQRFVEYLDRLADFFLSLRGPADELIPVLFRPFHEHTGDWFWWGSPQNSEEELRALYQFTVDYLRNNRGLKQLLFAYAPSGGDVVTERDYLYAYPGDERVDVLGFDLYTGSKPDQLLFLARLVSRLAEERGKVSAITEFGARDGGLAAFTIDSERWLQDSFLQPLLRDKQASRVAYVLAWRNATVSHSFLPFPGHPGAPGLVEACASGSLLLQPGQKLIVE